MAGNTGMAGLEAIHPISIAGDAWNQVGFRGVGGLRFGFWITSCYNQDVLYQI